MPPNLIIRIVIVIALSLLIGLIERTLKRKLMRLPKIGIVILGVLLLIVIIAGSIWSFTNERANKSAKETTRETIEYSMHTVDIETIDVPDFTYAGVD